MADHRPLSIDIRHPLLLKANDLVLLTREDGNIPPDVPGLGLFYRDHCYLAAYRLRLHGTKPWLLMSSDSDGMAAEMALTNRRLPALDGRAIADHQLFLRRTFLLLDDGPTFSDTISVRNFGADPVTLALSLEFATRFESVFSLRGSATGTGGRLQAPRWDETTLSLAYHGADDVVRTLLVNFSLPPVVAPRTTEQSIAHFELTLAPQESQDLIITCRVGERVAGTPPPAPSHAPPSRAALRLAKDAAAAALAEGYARVEASGGALEEVMARSLADLALLEIRRGEHRFTAAGMPWFVGLFGRDSLLPSIQCLTFNPDLSARTTTALAHWQGTKDDRETHEEPGKILHELRVGELAHLGKVPQTPSYAGVDATLLFLIAIARHVTSTGSLGLFKRLRANIDRALAWLDRKTAANEAGYITYDGLAEGRQPINQSWRDSGNGVLRVDGGYPNPPLALVEVQGYAYQARILIAALLRRNNESARADQLEAAAEALRSRFLRDFWMESEGCYCLALEQDGRQVASVTSNAAQVLWTGIATSEHADRISERMMRPDMFSGWGIRTLSAEHPRFDPIAYQQGSVWSFDNALIVSGLRRYGQDAAALRVTAATLDTARGFRLGRLPEFIAGNQRRPGDAPTHTPRADPLQAWSAAAVPFMVSELLGLHADGFARRLQVRRPVLPDGVDALVLRDMRVAGTTVSLRFSRKGAGTRTEVLTRKTDLEVVVE